MRLNTNVGDIAVGTTFLILKFPTSFEKGFGPVLDILTMHWAERGSHPLQLHCLLAHQEQARLR